MDGLNKSVILLTIEIKESLRAATLNTVFLVSFKMLTVFRRG